MSEIVPDTIVPPAAWRAVVEHLPAVIYVADFDERGTLRWISPQVQELLGYAPEAFLADDDLWYRCIHPDDIKRVREQERRAFEAVERFECEYRMIAADGSVRTVLERDAIVHTADGSPDYTQGVVLDLTPLRVAEEDRDRAERRIAYMAHHDDLTGLPNRALLSAHLAHAVTDAAERSVALAVVEFDLDDFKLVNDSLGHAAGDRLLGQVAGRLRSRVRAADMLARTGSDTFVAVLSDLDRRDATDAAMAAADGMLGTLDAPFELDGTVFTLGASAGLAIFPHDATDHRTLQRQAGAALHVAKSTGRGCVRRFRPVHDQTRRPLSLTARLRRAMDDGQLELHWQPIVEPASGAVHAVEGLVRWRDPEQGMLGPSAFVGFAEQSGLIERLDHYVLDIACAQAAEWAALGATAQVTVNVSPSVVGNAGYVGRVRACLETHSVNPEAIVLELTEADAMRSAPRTAAVMHDLAGIGVGIAVDDFGAGYSSLARLTTLPVSMLKVDRMFLSRVPADPDACAMLDAIARLARALRMHAVIEGVETEAQRLFVAELDGPLAQGFLLGLPAPAKDVTARLLATPAPPGPG